MQALTSFIYVLIECLRDLNVAYNNCVVFQCEDTDEGGEKNYKITHEKRIHCVVASPGTKQSFIRWTGLALTFKPLHLHIPFKIF